MAIIHYTFIVVIFRDQSLFEFHESGDSRVKKISRGKFIISSFILSVVFLTITIAFLKNFYYVDLANACIIKTKYSVHTENKTHLHQAIKAVRVTMPSDYKTLCNYVNNITETYCIVANEAGPIITYADSVGCYIKGTKTVFIQPLNTLQKPNSKDIAENLARYSRYSEEFWLNIQ